MAVREGYKQTEVGVIPEDWEAVKLGDVIEEKPTYGINAVSVPYDSNLPTYIRITDISEDGRFIKKNKTSVVYSDYKKYQLEENDIVFARTGASTGKSYLYDTSDGGLVYAGFLIRTRISKDVAVPKYIKACVETARFNEWVKMTSMRSGQPGINGNEYASFKMPLPPLPEQKAIATALSDMDGLIDSLSKLIEKKKNIKQGAMQELLTGNKRLEGFSGEWDLFELGDLIDYEQPTNYIVISTDYAEQGIPVLTAGKSFILGYTNEAEGVYENIPVIIFDDFTTTSKYVDFKFKVKSSAMKILRVKNLNHNLRLIFEYIQIIDFPLTDHQRYWISEYSKIKIKLPTTLEEQTAIATILSDMDSEIETLQAKLNKYKAIKQGMMQELLTGRIRLLEGA